MHVTVVIRGEEWISSVPLHQQLFDALGFEPVTYAHIAPLMKQITGGKRKLSKRKDPEASVDFYIEAGYPADAVLHYLRGLANGRLAELATRQGTGRAHPAGPVRYRRRAGRPGQARRHQRRSHRHPHQPAGLRRRPHLGRRVRRPALIRELAAKHGFAPNPKKYKNNPRRLPWLHPRSLPTHPRHSHRLHPQPRRDTDSPVPPPECDRATVRGARWRTARAGSAGRCRTVRGCRGARCSRATVGIQYATAHEVLRTTAQMRRFYLAKRR